MLRRSLRICQKHGVGGMPFSNIGNIYARQPNSNDYYPPKHDLASGTRVVDFEGKEDGQTVNPALQNAIDTCPYFALSDMATWFNMDISYLNPGVVTKEEHHLLLLHSRAYFEKWREIHAKPREVLPHQRIKKGVTHLLEKVCEASGATPCLPYLIQNLVDDASLVAMKPTLWSTVNLDPKLRAHLQGTILQTSGMTPHTQKKFHMVLDCMRTFKLFMPNGAEKLVRFQDATTLFDLYVLLDIPVYNGQLRVFDFVERGRVISLRNEDDYFDFLYLSFCHSDLVANIPYPGDSCARYPITVMKRETVESKTGFWF